MAPIPASNTTKLITDQTTIEAVGRLSISDSGGQFCVYVIWLPGRSVPHAHAAQKKNVFIKRRRSGVLIESAGMA